MAALNRSQLKIIIWIFVISRKNDLKFCFEIDIWILNRILIEFGFEFGFFIGI
jgi:hypothetical protein